MKTITKSVIKLSEIPEELQQYIVSDHKVHTYLEFHIDGIIFPECPLTLWLIETYPTIKRKNSFLIHIDK
jgi:hypothetical protein